MYGSLFNLTDSLFNNRSFPKHSFHNNLFNELEQLQQQLNGRSIVSNIRPIARGSFPAINLGSTATSVEVLAFVPGVDADSINVQIDKNLLTIEGERQLETAVDGAKADEKTTVYAQERFSGKFKRVVTLPEDVDVNNVSASCKDGVLKISVLRREETLPKRVEIH